MQTLHRDMIYSKLHQDSFDTFCKTIDKVFAKLEQKNHTIYSIVKQKKLHNSFNSQYFALIFWF